MPPRTLTAHLKPHERIILAWDRSDFNEHSKLLVDRLLPCVGMVKLGYQAIYSLTSFGTVALDMVRLVPLGGYFLDAKLEDIEHTMVEAIRAIVRWPKPPSIVSIHATMRVERLVTILEALRGSPILPAFVTVLTDQSDDDCYEVYGDGVKEVVEARAHRVEFASKKTGVPAAIICSPQELGVLKECNLTKITPGIRAKGDPEDDQERTMTAREAIEAGADYLIIGRPILGAQDPVAAAHLVAADIADGIGA